MIENTLIATLHQEFQSTLPCDIKPREAQVLEIKGLISCVLGPRRVGKTYLLFNRIQQLLSDKIPISSILYVNFEDDRLLKLDGAFLGELVDAFYELYPENFDKKVYLFFDEIQNIEGWSKPLRRFLDKLNCQIFVTGSSSKLLSREMTTSLRGRTITTTVYPLSFTEYQNFLSQQALTAPSKKEISKSKKQLTQYLMTGGFPLVIKTNETMQKTLLKEYFSLVLFKDVVEKFQVQNIPALNYIAKFGIKNHGRLFTGLKLYNDIKSQGLSLSKDKLFDYIYYLNDAFLLFYVPFYTESIRKQNSNPKKLYTIDSGLARSFEFKSEQDLGRKFENLIFLDLLRKNYEVCYYRTSDGQEIDFVISKSGEDSKLLQVCWDLSNESTLDREKGALKKAEKELGLKGHIITPETYLLGHKAEF